MSGFGRAEFAFAEVVEDFDGADPVGESGWLDLVLIGAELEGAVDVGAMIGTGKDDGEWAHWLLLEPLEDENAEPAHIVVVQDWFEELNRLVPAN